MSLVDCLMLLALVVVPIGAVVIGQVLQTHEKKREDKMRVFEAPMSSRVFGMNIETARAMNMIHIVFSRDKAVRERWSDYYESLCTENPDESQLYELEEKRNNLLKAMASALGYVDNVSQEALDTRYIPKGLVDAMNREQEQQNNYIRFLSEATHRLASETPFPKI